MSLHPEALPPVPESTAALARTVFRKGNRYMLIRDELGVFYRDQDFAALYPTRGQAAETPWRLALILVFQFMEGLSDREAAEAVRSRIDWKYALSLELTDPGFDASVLSEFRSRIVDGGQEQRLLDAMLKHLVSVGLLKGRGRQRSDSTHVLAAVRALNRYACVGETMRNCLNVLATVAPGWLHPRLQPEWVARYARRFDDYSLPAGLSKRMALVEAIGEDGCILLTPSTAQMHPVGYARCRRWKRCASSGCSSTMRPRSGNRCAGENTPTSRLPASYCTPHMTPMRATGPRVISTGWATKCT
jgi:transposase